MYLQNYTFEAAYAIAQVTAQPGGPIVYVPVRLESIFGFILPAIIFLGLWGGAWWRILSRLGYEGQSRILWLIGMLLFPLNAIALIIFAFLRWPNSASNQRQA